jgi:hypothetical protein
VVIASFPFVADVLRQHWIKSGLLAWLMMLPVASFAALPFANLMHLLTCEDEL